jgi:hypothetical protein
MPEGPIRVKVPVHCLGKACDFQAGAALVALHDCLDDRRRGVASAREILLGLAAGRHSSNGKIPAPPLENFPLE